MRARATTSDSSNTPLIISRSLANDPQIRRRAWRRTVTAPAELDDLEVVGGESVERGVEHVVVPACVHRAADVHVGAVVGDDQPIALHRAEDALRFRRVAG